MSRSQTALRWADRLQRFPHCGLSVARFCEAEGVSVSSFYHWRRKWLGQTTQKAKSDPAIAFLPVRLTQRDNPEPLPENHARSDALTTIDLPGGVRICVKVHFDGQPQPTGATQL